MALGFGSCRRSYIRSVARTHTHSYIQTLIFPRSFNVQFNFLRNSSYEFDQFTSNQTQVLNEAINMTFHSLHDKFSNTFNIEEYLK